MTNMCDFRLPPLRGKWIFSSLIAFFILFGELISANYNFYLNQRRRFDQVHVEVWCRADTTSRARLGYGSLVIRYNSDFLSPAVDQSPTATDSINFDIDRSNPIDAITSGFNSSNGYSGLGTRSYGNGYYSLELNLNNIGEGGLTPSQDGRGSFIGKIIFDIVNSPADTNMTGIEWSRSDTNQAGAIRLFDFEGEDVLANSEFNDPGDFTIVGIEVLSPDHFGQVVHRNYNYASLAGWYAEGGYPIYFERSVNPSEYTPPTGNAPALDEDLGYIFEFSVDAGTSFTEFGRISESDRYANIVGKNLKYLAGEMYNPARTNTYIITDYNGSQINRLNYRNPVRVIWAKDPNFNYQTKTGRIRIRILDGELDDGLPLREPGDIFDVSDEDFVIGKLFYLQFNGTNEYLKTAKNYSNSTQLTVEAWVNLNEYKTEEGLEPGIVVSSAGPDAAPINGSKEGAWMLYLEDGKYPAFRVREFEGRGPEGYLAKIIAYDALDTVSADQNLTKKFSDNWVHLAATVRNNVVTLYINGEISDQVTNNQDIDIRMRTTNHPIWVAVNPTASPDGLVHLPAGIKGVKIWRVAMTQQQVRERVAGVVDPSDVSVYGDLRRGLEIYAPLTGDLKDKATDNVYQNAASDFDFYLDEEIDNQATSFRPDMAHLKLTAPLEGVGVSNAQDKNFQVRWVSYGVGNIANAGSKDIEIEYSLDGGNTWNAAKNPANDPLAGNTAPDVEFGNTSWEPYLNNDEGFNLRDISASDKDLYLRIRGREDNGQFEINDIEGPFRTGLYFSIKKTEGSILYMKPSFGMNISGNTAYIEAWIRPYRFPTTTEQFFPIVCKMDTVTGAEHYSLLLLEDGRLRFRLMDENGNVKYADSDPEYPVVAPNSISVDSAWTHVGVYVFLNNGNGPSEVRFFVDGIPQRDDSLSAQLGDDLVLNTLNEYPVYFGYHSSDGISTGFVGEIRELRFWSGAPNSEFPSGQEPTPMSLFIQGAQSVRAGELEAGFKSNLYLWYSFNGGSFVNNGYLRSLASSTNNAIIARYYGEPISYIPTKPYIKLVEPEFRQQVTNSNKNVRVRWVGFDYDKTEFYSGKSGQPPSVEFSIQGGGGNIIQPYQFVAGGYWSGNRINALTFPDDDKYIFKGIGDDVIIAGKMDASVADPDDNDDGQFNDQGPLAASLTNARLRLTGQYTIYGTTRKLTSEGPLFTVMPSSNFTIRALLEGFHDGEYTGRQIRDIGKSYDEGGLRIWLYRDNSGAPGELVDSADSKEGYENRMPEDRARNTNNFANVNFIFPDLTDGSYWVVVDHLNHLPVMSRFAAPFIYEGDVHNTWAIESGWDFQAWNGEEDNVLPAAAANPYTNGYFTAYGPAVTDINDPLYSNSGLIFNEGMGGGKNRSLPALTGGDVDGNGQIDAADRVRVRLNDGTGTISSDVTGDGVVNADDRTVTDRNFGKISSIKEVEFDGGIIPVPNDNYVNDPFSSISEVNPGLSTKFNEAAKKVNYSIPVKFKDRTQAVFDFDLTAEALKNGNTIELSLYIKNNADTFALANCTFAVSYNSSVLKYKDLKGEENVIFSDDAVHGYSRIRSAPEEGASNPIPDVRTIEVDYDAFSNPGGLNVPWEKTFLGTLVFEITNEQAAVSFGWHSSTSIHSVAQGVMTDYADMQDIEPILLYNAAVVVPNGGESYAPGKQVDVSWSGEGTANVILEYSTNGGFNWFDLTENPVPVNQNTYVWTTPSTASSECLVRILDSETGKEVDRSDDEFSIMPNFAQIIRPSSGDPIYQGGASDYIRWVTQGYTRVRFEFSEDAGASWKSVSGRVEAKEGMYTWKLPNVTTKTALIRMIDYETDEVIASSGVFKILNGSLSFREPRAGDEYKLGRVRRIRWIAEELDEFDLDISYNGGDSWERLQSSVDAIRGYMDWTVEGEETTKAMLRALWNGDAVMEYDRSPLFSIVPDPGFVYDKLPAGCSVSETYPNPAGAKVYIDIKVNETEKIDIQIKDIAGRTILRPAPRTIIPGEAKLEIDLSGLVPGRYFITLSSGRIRAARAIEIVR